MRLGLLIWLACACGGSKSESDSDSNALAEQTVVKMGELRDRACACTDIRCTSQVLDEVTRWMKDPNRPKGQATADQRQRLAAIRGELDACEKKFVGKPPPPP